MLLAGCGGSPDVAAILCGQQSRVLAEALLLYWDPQLLLDGPLQAQYTSTITYLQTMTKAGIE
jgi:hypothetical protein